MYPNGHSFCYSERQHFTVVPKRPFVILQRNTKFYSCTQTAVRFFATNFKILKLYRNGYFVMLQRNKKFFKTAPKRQFAFLEQNTEF